MYFINREKNVMTVYLPSRRDFTLNTRFYGDTSGPRVHRVNPADVVPVVLLAGAYSMVTAWCEHAVDAPGGYMGITFVRANDVDRFYLPVLDVGDSAVEALLDSFDELEAEWADDQFSDMRRLHSIMDLTPRDRVMRVVDLSGLLTIPADSSYAEFTEHCHWSDMLEEYFMDEYFMQEREGGEERENASPETHVQGYHCGESILSILGAESAPFRIGFEIEKTDIFGASSQGDELNDYLPEWVSHVEDDSSCGVEAVSHVLPLTLEDGPVMDMLRSESSEDLLNEDVSRACGGHVTISSRTMTGTALARSMAEKAGLLFSIWRGRLSNSYVTGDDYSEKRDIALRYCKDGDDSCSRYAPIVNKGFGVEIRIPGAVSSARCLRNRYRFFAMFVHHLEDDMDTFLEAMRPVVRRMYDDRKKADGRLSDARIFQSLIDRTARYEDFISATQEEDTTCA